jgi:hypothetical protein
MVATVLTLAQHHFAVCERPKTVQSRALDGLALLGLQEGQHAVDLHFRLPEHLHVVCVPPEIVEVEHDQ